MGIQYSPLWSVTDDWRQMVERNGELESDPFNGDSEEWDAVLDAADETARRYGWASPFDRDDNELYACVLTHVDERHSLLRPGDVMVGAGSQDVLFVRPEVSA